MREDLNGGPLPVSLNFRHVDPEVIRTTKTDRDWLLEERRCLIRNISIREPDAISAGHRNYRSRLPDTVCPRCHELKLPHYTCLLRYKGKAVIQVEEV